MTYPLVLIQYPTGNYGFAGRVPSELAFDTDAPDLIEIACKHGPGIAKDIAKVRGCEFKMKSWPTAEAALAQAKQYGHKVAE